MRSLCSPLLALLAGGCPGAEAGQVTAEALRDAVVQQLSQQGLPVDAVRCADPRTADRAADRVDCEAVVGAATIPIVVAIGPDALHVRTREPTLAVVKLEPEVRATLVQHGHDVAALSCEGIVWSTRKGDTGRCTMTDASGRHWDYEATFTGDGAHHRAAIVAR